MGGAAGLDPSSDTIAAVEGHAPVPGGTLSYRFAGTADGRPCVVFENGWSASFPYACWLERALAPHARLLCYDRAGIGESRRDGPQTAAALTRQLFALLAYLKIDEPIVIAGHSYGGLMAALHAAQAPAAVRAIVELDPTPDLGDPLIDRQLGLAVWLGRFTRLCARLHIRDPFLSTLADDLPPEQAKRLLRGSIGSAASMTAALEELALLPAIRSIIAAGPKETPRLVISASATRPGTSWVQRLMGGEKVARTTVETLHRLHRGQAAYNGASRWETLPYEHGTLLTKPEGAAAVAGRLLAFLR